MAVPSPEHVSYANRYKPPEAALDEPVVDPATRSRDEALRQTSLRHETNVRQIGMLFHFAAFLGAVALFVDFAFWMGGGEEAAAAVVPVALVALGLLPTTVLLGSIGVGLRRFQPWAQSAALIVLGLLQLGIIATAVALWGLGRVNLANVPVWGYVVLVLPGAILGRLLQRPARRIFSAEHRDLVARTQRVQVRTHWSVKLLSVVVVIVVIVLVVFIVTGPHDRRNPTADPGSTPAPR